MKGTECGKNSEMGELLVPTLNKRDVSELYALFDKYDDDGSGELELEELTKMMDNLGVMCLLQCNYLT